MLANILNIVFILTISSVALEASWETVEGVEYFFGKQRINWYQAFAKCRRLGGYLASIDDKSEATILSDHLAMNYGRKVWWLSGADFHQKGNFYWYGTGNFLSHFAWCNNQPVDYNHAEDCVRFRHQDLEYGMENWACNKRIRYICEFEKPKTVINGELEELSVPFEKVGKKLFYLSTEKSSWHKAILSCRSMGSNLASINSPSEMKKLSKHLAKKASSNNDWWLSGLRYSDGHSFVWYGNGRPFNYTKWFTLTSSEFKIPKHCVKLLHKDSDYKMAVSPCNVKLHYICEITNIQENKT